jgi:hypothetical protein
VIGTIPIVTSVVKALNSGINSFQETDVLVNPETNKTIISFASNVVMCWDGYFLPLSSLRRHNPSRIVMAAIVFTIIIIINS